MPESPVSRGPYFVAAVTLLAHLAFVASGRMFPHDLNLAYVGVPELTRALDHGAWLECWRALRTPGGWYNLLLAAWLRLTGPGPVAFGAVAAGWVALVVVAAGALAGRLAEGLGATLGLPSSGLRAISRLPPGGGRPDGRLDGLLSASMRRAGLLPAERGEGARRADEGHGSLTAAALVASLPGVVVLARGNWIHLPEAALFLTAGALLARDPRLDRVATAPMLGVCGALVAALRPSGLGWLALLVVAVLASGAWRRVGRFVTMALVWALGASVSAPALVGYLTGKAGVRERYAMEVPPLPIQVLSNFGWVGIGLVGVGLACVAVGFRGRPPPAMAVILGGGVVGPLVVSVVSRAGIDNFPLFAVALGVIAGVGLARSRVGTAAVLLAWAFGTTLRLHEDLSSEPDPAPARVLALLDSSCPQAGPPPSPALPPKPGGASGCRVVADPSLFSPAAEEPGRLELFLLGRPDVEVRPAGMRAPVPPDAVATWDCPGRRGVGIPPGFTEAWSGPIDGCIYRWFTKP